MGKFFDAEVARSLELIAAMNDSQLSDLALTFSVARPTLNGVHDISLRGNGCEEVTEANVREFARLSVSVLLVDRETVPPETHNTTLSPASRALERGRSVQGSPTHAPDPFPSFAHPV